MHSTERRSASRGLFFVLLALVAALVLAPAALASGSNAGTFTGGPLAGDCPTTIANDQTVYALRFSVTAGLQTNTTYYVKIRFTPNPDGTPAGTDNRGFTWCPATATWAQERDGWTSFPTISTSATSATITESDWFYFKFGDTAKTGPYQILVSLSTGTSGNTLNASTTVPVTVFDPATQGYWVHGVAMNTSTQPPVPYSSKRIEVDDTAPSATDNPLALQFTASGSGDPTDAEAAPLLAAGYRLAVPLNKTVDVVVNTGGKTKANLATDFTSKLPDVDIALGATDQTPPSAPATLTATNDDGVVDLSWAAATDNNAVIAYDVYRWTDAPLGAGYSEPMALVHTVTGATSWTDTSVTPGTAYHYLVRAEDAATNIGPRSPQADVTPQVAAQLSLQQSAKVVKWGGAATLTGALTSTAPFTAGQQVWVETSFNGSTWTRLTTPLDPSSTSSSASLTYSTPVKPTRATCYRLVFAGDAAHTAATSAPVKVKPRVKLGTPIAPKTVHRRSTFGVYGSLVPHQTPGHRSVRIKCYRKSGGKWVLKKVVRGKDTDYRTYTRYKAKLSLPRTGSWKLMAYFPATSRYAATRSHVRYVKVK